MDYLDDGLARLRAAYVPRSCVVVDLNCLRLRLVSNVAGFTGHSYFPALVPVGPDLDHWDYELVCVDLDADRIDIDLVAPLADRTFRAERFRTGFYLTHHYGPPAYLVTRGNQIHVFGHRLEQTVWTYFVKHLLTVFAIDRAMLHLKAAAFVPPSGAATLLFGRGSGGKTVFLTEACRDGARFLSNTHVLVQDRTVHGIPSVMRVRHDRSFGDLIASGRIERHLYAGEYRVDPSLFFGAALTEAPIGNLCIVDYRPDAPTRFDAVDAESFTAFLDLFAFAISTYGLKDDVLAHVGGDFDRYVAAYTAMKQQLADLVRATPRFYVNADMFDPAIRARVLRALAGG